MQEKSVNEPKFVEHEEDPRHVTFFGDVTEPYNEDAALGIERGWVRVERDIKGSVTKAFLTVEGQKHLQERAVEAAASELEFKRRGIDDSKGLGSLFDNPYKKDGDEGGNVVGMTKSGRK